MSTSIKRRTSLLLGGAALGSLSMRARAQEKTVRIGVIQPMSGHQAAYGQQGQAALQAVVSDINASGGIKSLGGAKLEMILADDGSQPSRTASELRRLVTEENVSVVIGTLLTNELLGATPVINEFKVPTLAFWGSVGKGDYVYSLTLPTGRGYAKTLCDFGLFLRDKGYSVKTAAIAYSNYEAGQDIARSLKQMLADKGIETVAELPLDTSATDATPAMLRIRSLKPDVVFGGVTVHEGTLLHQARYYLNYHDSLFAGGIGGFSDPVLWKNLGPEIAKTVLTRNFFGLTNFSLAGSTPGATALIKELREKKIEPGQAEIVAAQGARVLQRVLELAGSTDREAIRAAFDKVHIPAGDPDLYLMRADGISFAADHFPADSTALMIQWQPDQTQQIVFPAAYAQVPPRPKT